MQLGFQSERFFHRGRVGLTARGRGISYEVPGHILSKGIGISTCVNACILRMFKKDDETDKLMFVDKIRGTSEEKAAIIVKKKITKPVLNIIVDRTSTSGKRMEHAGAMRARMGIGSYESKKTLNEAGVFATKNAAEAAALPSLYSSWRNLK